MGKIFRIIMNLISKIDMAFLILQEEKTKIYSPGKNEVLAEKSFNFDEGLLGKKGEIQKKEDNG